nr:immunoglobulin light chain junction region [Macaca mulatta]MOX18460.1 immunoglobulin light chain junction region [Macaca mulatta]
DYYCQSFDTGNDVLF